MTTKKVLMDFFGGIVRHDLWNPFTQESPDDIVIDDVDVEIWLDKYTIFRGGEKELLDFIADCVVEEYERRLNYFNCETEEASDFLKSLLESQFVSLNPTMHKSGSLFQTAADVFSEDYIVYKLDDEYFVFDNSEESKFDYESLVSGYDYKIWDFPGVLEVIKEKLN